MRKPLLVVLLASLHMYFGAIGAQARPPKIEVLPLEWTLLTDQGVTATSIDVSYRIEFIPPGAVRAEVVLLRDKDPIRTFPAPLKAGLNKVTLPAGLQMENPADYIAAQVEMPGGKLSESSVVMVYEQADYERRDRSAKARIARVVPALITQQRSPQFIQLFGSNLASLADRMTIDGMSVDAQVAGNALTLAVPKDIFRSPGFVYVQPRADFMGTQPDPGQIVRLAVADPTLPGLGGLTSVMVEGFGPTPVRIDGVDYQADQYNERLSVRGAGFRPRMQMVIGRGRTPIYALSTEMQSTTAVSAALSYGAPADDYFIAMLSADKKQMTRAFPIASPDKMRAAAAVPTAREEPVRLTAPGFRVYGNVAWNLTQPQWLYLEGPIAKPGMRVWLRSDGKPVAVEAIAAEPAVAPGLKYPVVRVPVPAALTHKAKYNISIVIHPK